MKDTIDRIEEDNKILAIFDGTPESDYPFMLSALKASFLINEGYSVEYVDENYEYYHNCWKHLIPLCQEIKKVSISENMGMDIPVVRDLQISILSLNQTEIHQSCVNFVKYYNKVKAESDTSTFFT